MTLVEILEPLFQHLCKLNRLGRAGGGVGPRLVRDELRAALAEARTRADREGLGGPFDKIEVPVVLFSDHMVRASRLAATWPPPNGWRPLAEEYRHAGGDDRFWEALEEALAEPGESADQRLAVFYTMIGLGFAGGSTRPDMLRKTMREIAARVRGLVEADLAGRITPDAYEHADTRTLTRPPARKLMGMLIVLAGMVIVFLITYRTTFVSATGELNRTLTEEVIKPAGGRDRPPR
jgi:type VI protein secretion system component VasF